MTSVNPGGIRRILVLKWSAMGDVALASAALDDIADAYPEAALDLSTVPPWDRLYAHDPRLNHIHAIDVRGGGQLGASWRWLKTIGARRYDLVFDLQTTDRSRVMLGLLWLTGGQIRYRVGNKRAFPYNLWPQQPQRLRHAMDIIHDSLRAAGVPARTTHPVLHCPPDRRQAVSEELQRVGARAGAYAVLLPGSQAAGSIKRWGAERYAGLANLLQARGMERVLILGGPDEIDECARIDALTSERVVNLCGRTELLDLVAYCEGARLVVGNDTGTAHVGSAAARPMLIICGPTDPNRVLPAGASVHGLQADLPCINCYQKHCAHHSCMAWVTPEMVLSELERIGAL